MNFTFAELLIVTDEGGVKRGVEIGLDEPCLQLRDEPYLSIANLKTKYKWLHGLGHSDPGTVGSRPMDL